MSALLGADTRRVDLVAQRLLGHSQDLQDLRTRAQRAVAELRGSWAGPGFELAAERWGREAGPRLTDVSAALGTMAGALRAQAEEQRQASSGGMATGGCQQTGGHDGPAGGVVPVGGGSRSGGWQNTTDSLELDDAEVRLGALYGKEYHRGDTPTHHGQSGLDGVATLKIAEGEVSVHRSALSLEGGDDGDRYELSAARVEATAGYAVEVDDGGNLVTSANASAAAYAGYAAGSRSRGSEFAHGTVGGKAFVGAEASTDASASIGPDGASGHLGAEAFAGVKAEGEVSGTVGGVTAAAGAEISFGIGAHANADAELTADNIGLSMDLGAAVGVGTGVKFDVSINPQEVLANVQDAVDDLERKTG